MDADERRFVAPWRRRGAEFPLRRLSLLFFHQLDQARLMRSPAFKVTMAFFQSDVLPRAGLDWRRALPRTFEVLTRKTLTLKSSWTALRIWILLARRSATTVY